MSPLKAWLEAQRHRCTFAAMTETIQLCEFCGATRRPPEPDDDALPIPDQRAPRHLS
jgi:hypothetical protein